MYEKQWLERAKDLLLDYYLDAWQGSDGKGVLAFHLETARIIRQCDNVADMRNIVTKTYAGGDPELAVASLLKIGRGEIVVKEGDVQKDPLMNPQKLERHIGIDLIKRYLVTKALEQIQLRIEIGSTTVAKVWNDELHRITTCNNAIDLISHVVLHEEGDPEMSALTVLEALCSYRDDEFKAVETKVLQWSQIAVRRSEVEQWLTQESQNSKE